MRLTLFYCSSYDTLDTFSDNLPPCPYHEPYNQYNHKST